MKKIIFLFFILVSSCNETKKASEIIGSNYHLTESDFVIIPYEKDMWTIYENAKPTGITQAELNEIEDLLILLVEDNNQIQKKLLIKHNKEFPKYKREKTGRELNLIKYKRQYVPVINENGEKEVWINFFCSDYESSNWKKQIVKVFDGGNCLWNVKVSLTKKECYELGINSSA